MKRPSYTHTNSIGEKIVELFILIIIVGAIIHALMTFSKLPDKVPIHIGINGKVDNYGNKGMLLAMPLIGLLSYIGLSFLQRFPNIFNYPIEVTEKNAEALYSLGIKMARCLKLFVVLVFAIGSINFTELALGRKFNANYIIIVLLAVMSIMMIYYIVKMAKQQE